MSSGSAFVPDIFNGPANKQYIWSAIQTLCQSSNSDLEISSGNANTTLSGTVIVEDLTVTDAWNPSGDLRVFCNSLTLNANISGNQASGTANDYQFINCSRPFGTGSSYGAGGNIAGFGGIVSKLFTDTTGTDDFQEGAAQWVIEAVLGSNLTSGLMGPFSGQAMYSSYRGNVGSFQPGGIVEIYVLTNITGNSNSITCPGGSGAGVGGGGGCAHVVAFGDIDDLTVSAAGGTGSGSNGGGGGSAIALYTGTATNLTTSASGGGGTNPGVVGRSRSVKIYESEIIPTV